MKTLRSILLVAPLLLTACDTEPFSLRGLSIRTANGRSLEWLSRWQDDLRAEEPVPLRARFTLEFTELVDIDASMDAVHLETDAGPLPMELTTDGPRDVTLLPDEPLPEGTRIEITVDPEFRAWSGAQLGLPFQFELRTQGQPSPTKPKTQ